MPLLLIQFIISTRRLELHLHTQGSILSKQCCNASHCITVGKSVHCKHYRDGQIVLVRLENNMVFKVKQHMGEVMHNIPTQLKNSKVVSQQAYTLIITCP